MGILILEVFLCLLLNNLLKNTLNKKIRYAICIALLLNCSNMRTYQAMQAIHTPFCLLVLLILFKKKKAKRLYDPFSYHIHFHRYFWICEYVYYPSNLIQPNNHKKITPTKICFISDVHYPNAINPERLKEITNTLLKVKPNFYLLGGDFVDEFTSKEDMKILFKLARLTKVAPVYFVYGNNENKIKFTRNKFNQEITKNNIAILNDQEVHIK